MNTLRRRPLDRKGGDPLRDSSNVSQPGSDIDGAHSVQTEQHDHNRWRLLLGLFGFHFVLALITRTFFQPDEYWQSLEIAHRLVEGYGYLTWEWSSFLQPGQPSAVSSAACESPLLNSFSWAAFREGISFGPIRSPLYALAFVPVYKALRLLRHLDLPFWLSTAAPRLLQAGFSTVTAYSTFMVASEFGERAAAAALLSLLTSPFYLYTACRTFSNNLETTLTMLAIRECLAATRAGKTNHRRILLSLMSAAVACLVRPTSGLLWPAFYSCIVVRLQLSGRKSSAAYLLTATVAVIGLAFITALCIDTWFYGQPTLTLLAFFVQNVSNSIANFYGTQPWHWYLSQGLPVVGMTALPFMLLGGTVLWKARTGETASAGQTIVITTVWTIAVYSLALSHKEWRFLLPIVPLLHIMAGAYLASGSHLPRGQRSSIGCSMWTSTTTLKRSALLCTLPFSAYLVLFHGVAQSVHLPRFVREQHSSGRLHSLALLMPCHSTPWQSAWQLSNMEIKDSTKTNGSGDWGRLWFLTCEPPRSSSELELYQDQSDYFYRDPQRYIAAFFPREVDCGFPPSRGWNASEDPHHYDVGHKQPQSYERPHAWPSHIAMFEALLSDSNHGQSLSRHLQSLGYKQVARLWNSLLHDDARRRGAILVWAFDQERCKDNARVAAMGKL
ncbi:unnamed protein product [Parajaminaea phylloscopi]